MKVLILGKGGREHALAWKFVRSNRITGLYCAPGNPGTAELGTNVEINANDVDAVVETAIRHSIDLVFVGPEEPLAADVVSALADRGIAAIGPPARSARLESSKSFAKAFMERHGVPTAAADVVQTESDLHAFVSGNPGPVVVKMDGLAGGKGVREFNSATDAVPFANSALKSGPVLLEERLHGIEVSAFALIDSNGHRILPPCADYKKSGERGTGSNTGGMGSISPVPWIADETWSSVKRTIIEPSIEGLRNDGLDYTGVLYIGVMLTEHGPYTLEYNVRLGDPETQVILPLLRADILDVCEAMIDGSISRCRIETDDLVSVGVVVASAGYPDSYQKDVPVTIDNVDGAYVTPRSLDRLIFHSGTRSNEHSQIVTAGGRCFTCVCRDTDVFRARTGAYELAESIHFDGAWSRTDIAARVFGS